MIKITIYLNLLQYFLKIYKVYITVSPLDDYSFVVLSHTNPLVQSLQFLNGLSRILVSLQVSNPEINRKFEKKETHITL